MTGLRDERAAALIRRHRDLADDFTRALPGLLDALERIDREHGVPDAVIRIDATTEITPEMAAALRERLAEVVGSREDLTIVQSDPRPPTDAELTAWIEAHPAEFAAWAAKQAKPQPRRRTARKET